MRYEVNTVMDMGAGSQSIRTRGLGNKVAGSLVARISKATHVTKIYPAVTP